jgi:hypothetical protein
MKRCKPVWPVSQYYSNQKLGIARQTRLYREINVNNQNHWKIEAQHQKVRQQKILKFSNENVV